MAERVGFGKYLKVMFTVGDFIILNLAWLLTLLIIGSGHIFASRWVWLVVNVSYVPAVFLYSGLHNNRILFADKVVLTSLKSIVLMGVCMYCLLYILDIYDIGLKASAWFFSIFWILLSAWWLLARWVLKRVRRMGVNFKRAVVVGTGNTACLLIHQIMSDAGYGFKILCLFDDPPVLRTQDPKLERFKVLPVEALSDFVSDNKVDIIYYTKSEDTGENLRNVMRIAEENGSSLVYVPVYDKIISGMFQPDVIGSIPSMVYTMSPLQRTGNKIAKRALDLAVSVPFLIFSPLIFLPIAIIIKITSPGPIFFKQKRTGMRGQDFLCYKFRTMHVNKDSDKVQATENDPRKTKFGDFLRRSSLDELPQFINVFLGDMSVVGPRPHMLMHTHEYSQLIKKYMVRHAVKPGITGWAQVNGFRGGTKHLWQMEKRVEYDVWYIRHWNLMLDIKIIFLTAFNSLRGDSNAY